MHAPDGANIFQSIDIGVAKQIKANWSPRLEGVHCWMFACTIYLVLLFFSIACMYA
jgi:hypothetical protein